MNSNKKVRVRFAPSPTGPLHIGGVRTALYNYLFAKKNNGTFILRIEDTDQARYVSGAEEYIINALEWLGISPEESATKGGSYGPYRQSERKEIYKHYADQLISSGNAYYAFDTQEELEAMRVREKEAGNHTAKYDQNIRKKMRNSLTLNENEVTDLLSKGKNVTVRMKVPENETITFEDVIRGEVSFNTSELDDKVILKADGLPTYHMANVVDDKLMEISHVIRGEEWLSSTSHHVLLYHFFDWNDDRPTFAHLPLILKPSGKGKLSKRDGAQFGFPVFPLEWYDEKEGETFAGFRKEGFLAEALLNFLVFLGWNPGTEQEVFTSNELIPIFTLEKINKSGAKFNYDKAKWFNQQYIIGSSSADLYNLVYKDFINVERSHVEDIIELLKPRVHFLSDFKKMSLYFFNAPVELDQKGLKKKYKIENQKHFENIANLIKSVSNNSDELEGIIKSYITDNELSFGTILPPLRIFLTGAMSGPDLFKMIELIGNCNCSDRILNGIATANSFPEDGQEKKEGRKRS